MSGNEWASIYKLSASHTCHSHDECTNVYATYLWCWAHSTQQGILLITKMLPHEKEAVDEINKIIYWHWREVNTEVNGNGGCRFHPCHTISCSLSFQSMLLIHRLRKHHQTPVCLIWKKRWLSRWISNTRENRLLKETLVHIIPYPE